MWDWKLYGFIKSRGLDEMAVLVWRDGVRVDGEVGDLGHNQTMTAAKSSATATIMHSCADNPSMQT